MEVSYDGEHFERVDDLKGGAAVIENPRRGIKAVRVVCTQSGNGESFVTVQEPKIYPVL